MRTNTFRPAPSRAADAGSPPPAGQHEFSQSESSRVVRFVRRYPVAVFLGWFFTVGQAVAFTPLIGRQVFGTELPSAPFLMVATAVGLMLPTILITWIVEGRQGLDDLRRRTMAARVGPRWYAFAVIEIPLTITAVTAALFGLPEQASAAGLGRAAVSGFVVHLFVVFLTFNLWEEVTWMGFVQARLQGRHGPAKAATMTGVVFALGHISQVLEGSVSEVVLLVALLVVVCIPFRALQAWVYNRTGSLLVVGLVHAAGNATAAGSIVGAGFLDRLYPDAGAGGLVFPVLGAVGAVVFAATRGRLGRRPQDHVMGPSPRLDLADAGGR